jgi:SEC-C motif-containing protein
VSTAPRAIGTERVVDAAHGPAACPCRSGAPTPLYADCCGRYHAGVLHLRAPGAEALMRSRYSAFALDLLDYLLATWHASTRPTALEPNPPGLRWLGLEVRAQHVLAPDRASVEFVARSKPAGRAQRLHELSRFVREEGRWFYVDGTDRTAGAAPAR